CRVDRLCCLLSGRVHLLPSSNREGARYFSKIRACPFLPTVLQRHHAIIRRSLTFVSGLRIGFPPGFAGYPLRCPICCGLLYSRKITDGSGGLLQAVNFRLKTSHSQNGMENAKDRNFTTLEEKISPPPYGPCQQEEDALGSLWTTHQSRTDRTADCR